MAAYDTLMQEAITIRNNTAPSSNTAVLVGGLLVEIVAALQTISAASADGKADKVASATAGDFAALTADGNLADSGYTAGSFLQPQADLTTFSGTMQAGKTVLLSTAIASLTVTAIESGYLESNLIFTVSGSAFTLTLPTGTLVAGTLPTFEAGTSYILTAFHGIVVCSELTTIS